MEKKLAEYKCDTNEALSLKLGMCVHFLQGRWTVFITTELVSSFVRTTAVCNLSKDTVDERLVATLYPSYLSFSIILLIIAPSFQLLCTCKVYSFFLELNTPLLLCSHLQMLIKIS